MNPCISNKVYILGGCCDGDSKLWSTVSLFEKDIWQKCGTLNQGRLNPMTIFYGTEIMIVGGATHDNNP